MLTNAKNLSLSVAVWLAEDKYDYINDPDYISATGIIKPTRQIILSSRNKKAYEEDVIDRIPTSMGTALHDGIEQAWLNGYKRQLYKMGYPETLINRIVLNPHNMDPKDVLKIKKPIFVYMEKRSFRRLGKWNIGGKFDFLGDGTLEDFKSTGTYQYMQGSKDEDNALQGSIYKWLNPKIVTSDYMLIQYIFTDWSKLRSMIEAAKGYPEYRIVSHKLQLMSLQETEQWLLNKLALLEKYNKAPEPDIPFCNQKELWQKESEFKYYKNPNKTARATRNFDTYHEANARYLADGSVGTIIEKTGEVKKCLYCNGFEVCTQKNIYVSDGSLNLE